MNDAYVHLIVNHVPIFSMLFGVLILGWGLWKKSEQIQGIAALLFIIGAIASYVAIESGEGAEEVIEESSVVSVSHDAIHEHEEAAEVAFWFSLLTGGLAVVGLFANSYNIRYKNVLAGVLLVSSLVALGTLIYTGYQGGKIHHPEAHSTVNVDGGDSYEVDD